MATSKTRTLEDIKRFFSKDVDAKDKETADKFFSGEGEKTIAFQCRICKYTEYLPHYTDNGLIGPGYQRTITHYSCAGCSALFNDPIAFTKKLTRKNK